MQHLPQLVVVEGALEGERFAVGEEALVIGRAPSCQIRVEDPGVSREHAQVFLRNSTVWVQDRGSRNGVFVNGKRIARPKTMGVGDALVVGAHRFVLELGDDGADEAETPSPSPDAAPDGAPAGAPPASPPAAAPAAGGPNLVVIGVAVAVVLVLLGIAAFVSAG